MWWLNKLFLGQCVAHLSLIPMLLYAGPKEYLICLVVYFLMGCVGMSMTYHRQISHQSWKSTDWFKYFGLLCGTLALTGSCITWSVIHRRHHQFSDTIHDPHSPQYLGFWRVEFLSMLAPIESSWFRPFLKDKSAIFFHKNYWRVHLIYATILLVVKPFMLVYAYLLPAAMVWHGGSLVNTLGHMWGYRRFETNDDSRNNFLLTILFWGEGWHNNHHRYPKKFYFGDAWYEFDLAGWIIRKIKV